MADDASVFDSLIDVVRRIADLGPAVHSLAVFPSAPRTEGRSSRSPSSPMLEAGDREGAALWAWACTAVADADDALVDACRSQHLVHNHLDHRAVRVPVLQTPRDAAEQERAEERAERRLDGRRDVDYATGERCDHPDGDLCTACVWRVGAAELAGAAASPSWLVATLRHMAVGLSVLDDAVDGGSLDVGRLQRDLKHVGRHLDRAERHLRRGYGQPRRRPRECVDDTCDNLPKGNARYCDSCRQHKSRHGVARADCKWCRLHRPHPKAKR